MDSLNPSVAAKMGVAQAARWILSSFVSRSLGDRDLALDAFRGLAIIGMILVNHPPPNEKMYAPFVHAAWHGWTMADTIFPAFLFAVGISIAFALPSGTGRGMPPCSPAVYLKIARRSLLLIAISVALVNFPYYELAKLKIAGVLAQIGWCYLFASLLHLHARWPAVLATIVAIWLGNWALLALLDVPGFGAGHLTPEGNASRYLDQLVFGPHAHMFDFGEKGPYGLLVIVSSISTTCIGVLAGHWLRAASGPAEKINGAFASGLGLCILANIWDAVLPINKLMWTSSFAALTAGISLQVLALFYWLIEVRQYRSWSLPLQVAGVNALVFYVFAQSFQRLLVYGRIRGEDGVPLRFRDLLFEQVFAPWVSGKFGALIYTLAFMAICFGVIVLLYRKRIYVKL